MPPDAVGDPMWSDQTVIRLIRAVAAVVIVAVLATQLENALRRGVDPWDFLSYFTVVSNVASAAVLGFLAWRPERITASTTTLMRGTVTLSMCVTALLYGFWISPSFSDAVRHLVGPMVLVTDWILHPSPRVGRIRGVAEWMVLPVAYLLYTLVRGYLTDWYPYGFLDPVGQGGLSRFLVFCGILTLILVCLALVLRAWTGRDRGATGAVVGGRQTSHEAEATKQVPSEVLVSRHSWSGVLGVHDPFHLSRERLVESYGRPRQDSNLGHPV